jgi:hypothetical protein
MMTFPVDPDALEPDVTTILPPVCETADARPALKLM